MVTAYNRLMREVSRDLSSVAPARLGSPFTVDQQIIMEIIFRELRANRYAPSIRQIMQAFPGSRSSTFVCKRIGELKDKGYLKNIPNQNSRAIIPVLKCNVCQGSGRIATESVLIPKFDNPHFQDCWNFIVNHELSGGSPPTTREIAEAFGYSPGYIWETLKRFQEMGLMIRIDPEEQRLRTVGVVPCPGCVLKRQAWEPKPHG